MLRFPSPDRPSPDRPIFWHVPFFYAIVHCSYETWMVHHVSQEQPLFMYTTVGVLINVYIFNTKDRHTKPLFYAR